ncbi:MAG: hypothetical protein KAV69_03175, partial [Deltaproteobacteria bacterium]|nr:hypothetical protein [Deltaproteobacteria bacterium]
TFQEPIPIIPIFHHSNIPDARQEYLPQPPPVNSMSCRNSETSNYTLQFASNSSLKAGTQKPEKSLFIILSKNL